MNPGNCVVSVMLADNAAGVQERCRASSHCSAHSRDRSASWLASGDATVNSARRRRSRQHVPKTVLSSRFETWQIAWLKRHNLGAHVFPGSAELGEMG